MINAVATIDWGEGKALTVLALSQLDQALDRIVAQGQPDKPTIMLITMHGHTLTVGLGASEGFVQLAESDHPPYLITVGHRDASGQVTFLFQDVHDTDISRRNLVPSSTARAIVREYFTTGRRLSLVPWEEV